jgi:hypothetical protein
MIRRFPASNTAFPKPQGDKVRRVPGVLAGVSISARPASQLRRWPTGGGINSGGAVDAHQHF